MTHNQNTDQGELSSLPRKGSDVSIEARREYLRAIRERYRKATRKQKTIILDEFCEVCGYSRKYAIRVLKRQSEPRTRRPGPQAVYGLQELRHLRVIWLAMGEICSKHLKTALPEWLKYYDDSALTPEIREKLLRMSPASIDRLLRSFRESRRRGLSSTKGHLNRIKNKIPIQLVIGREIKKPGFLEADTVAHCGGSLEGYFINSLTMTDIFSGWTEKQSQLDEGTNSRT